MINRPFTFTIVTGNQGKLDEFRRLLPSTVSFDHQDIDLPEIQSLDSTEIVIAKAVQAYSIVGKPVLVEDVTAGLDELGGLPGPFIKFFVKQMGHDALYQLRGESAARAICTIAFYDGSQTIIAKGEVLGLAVAARGSNGFGFDSSFQPTGSNKTYAEMQTDEKDSISHRSLAVKDLVEQLNRL